MYINNLRLESARIQKLVISEAKNENRKWKHFTRHGRATLPTDKPLKVTISENKYRYTVNIFSNKINNYEGTREARRRQVGDIKG